MNAPKPESGVSPQQVSAELTDIEWLCHTNKLIHGQHHAVELFGFLNPLRATAIELITETELEWIYAQTEQSLLQCAAFNAEKVALVILCAIGNPNPAMRLICKKHRIAWRGVWHGVFLAVMNTGALITGASGIDKSEVAMDLPQRGTNWLLMMLRKFTAVDKASLLANALCR